MQSIIADAGNPLSFLTEFGVEWQMLLSQALSFAIVASALYIFVFKPVIKASAERKQKIEQGLKDADDAKARLANAESEANTTISEASVEAAKILKQARDDAKATIEQSAAEANQKAAEIRAKAEEQIAKDKIKMKEELKAELSDLVVQATEATVAEVLTDAQRAQLAEIASRKLNS